MTANDSLSLFDLRIGQEGKVSRAPTTDSGSAADRELALRLVEIGFIDGERVRVVARAHPDGDPIAVRVGNTMFALRRCEAEQVLVAPLTSDIDARQPERMRAAIAAAAPSPANVNPSATGRRCAVPARERRA